ncbi:MAG: hypothetical protein ABI900_06985 [Betaproteobacteria bacterium]
MSAALALVEIIAPSLHQIATLAEVQTTIVRRAHFVAGNVAQLQFGEAAGLNEKD